MSGTTIINNEELRRFEIEIDGEYAYLEYKFYLDSLVLIHTFTPVSMRGQGISSALAKYALELAIENDLKVIVYCPFVTAYLRSHPEYEAQLDITYKHS